MRHDMYLPFCILSKSHYAPTKVYVKRHGTSLGMGSINSPNPAFGKITKEVPTHQLWNRFSSVNEAARNRCPFSMVIFV